MQKAINQRLGINKDSLDFPLLSQDEPLPNFSSNNNNFSEIHTENVIMNTGKSKSQSASQRPNNFNYHAYFTGSIRHHPKGLQVSSQGCSRVFIVKVLLKVSDYVQGKRLPSIFTFQRELVMGWLEEAKAACSDMNYDAEEAYYGGPPFIENDLSTHWSEPHQLYTWWKNNVERRTKYKIIQDDSLYEGTDPRRVARARWCQVIVTLSEIIRASSGSTVSSNIKQKSSDHKKEPKKQKTDKDKRGSGDSDVILTDEGVKQKSTRKRKYDIDDEVLFDDEPKKERKKPGRKKGWKKAVAKDDDSGSFADDFEDSDSASEDVNVSHRLIPKAAKEVKVTKSKEKPKAVKPSTKPASPGYVLSKFAEAAVNLPFATLKYGASNFTKNLKTVLTELNDEDFLDLTVPKTKRIFIDINGTDKNDNNDTNNDDYYYAGPCFGIFYPKDSFTNSKTKPLSISTINTRAHLQLQKDINKKEKPCSRTGIEYQAEIFDMNPDAIDKKEFKVNQVWDSNRSMNIDVTALYNSVSQSHRDEILALGLICRLKLPNVKDKSYRLCCILEIGIQDSNLVRVFDGRDELMVPPSSCIPFSVNYIEGLLAITHNSNYVEVTPSLQDMIMHNSDRHDFASNWSANEVAIFCNSIQRYGDNLRKVWLLFEKTKTLKEILDFFHRVYPYTQRIGVKGFISIFRRADSAKAGIPDDLVEEDNNNNNQEDVEIELVQQQSYLKFDKTPEDDIEQNLDGTVRGKGKKRKTKSDSPINNLPSTVTSNFFASDHHFGTLQRKKKPGRPKQKTTSLGLANDVEEADELLCICHILRTDDRYICCTVGNLDNCNGWVHLECVGLEDYADEELQTLTDYICPSCKESNE